MSQYEGKLGLLGDVWVLDAEPFAMDFFGRVFPSNTLFHPRNKAESRYTEYTHRPRCLRDGLDNRRDIEWFLSRFKLQISDKDRAALREGTAEYERIQQETDEIISGDYVSRELPLAMPLRDYQRQACELFWKMKSLIVGDVVGLGKTPTGIGATSLSEMRPALVVAPAHLVSQWESEIHKFLPEAEVHVIRTLKPYVLPPADYYVTAYSRLHGWEGVFADRKMQDFFKSLVLDEVHELRRPETKKYAVSKLLSGLIPHRLALSATPIMNYGEEIFHIVENVRPGALGNYSDFIREWCHAGSVRNPTLLGNFLRKRHVMIRRTREDVERTLEPVNKIVYTVDADLKALKEVEDVARKLALQVFTGSFSESGRAARELDYKLRHATGMAKAKAVAEYAKMIIESGEKVVLFGWHHDVYDVWMGELSAYHPVKFTGSETPSEKEKSVKAFREGSSKVFIMSLRSGAGLNGLQDVSSYAIFGELDWSPQVHEQCIGRLNRDGLKGRVTAIFITVRDGADPVMLRKLGVKASEQRGIIDPNAPLAESLEFDAARVKELARGYLERQGVAIPERGQDEEGIHAEISEFLSGLRLSLASEGDMQDGIEQYLRPWAEERGLSYKREATLGGRESRIDFLVGEIGIECKVGGSRPEAYRQLKRYAESGKLRGLVLVGPWDLSDFDAGGLPVKVVNGALGLV